MYRSASYTRIENIVTFDFGQVVGEPDVSIGTLSCQAPFDENMLSQHSYERVPAPQAKVEGVRTHC
jgi:hypothetical protein